ncbi:50S ribosomal protein L15 [Euzebya tangerina]|uniref:50S ribosomal protein L15 n=1 Tax=Euzebya tangerina TaxID=591198 RepID=UPI000E316EA7|nr:50S ribosomal protein L15 [Euzebya tangerina]
MKLNELKPAPGSTKRKTRKGRGEAAGKGKTAGRGTKGTGARKNVPLGFEGGQMPLQRRLPKLPGFNSRNRVEHTAVNVSALEEVFDAGDEVTPELMAEAGLIRSATTPVKILGDGEITIALTVTANSFSKSAEAKITEAGGSVQTVGA